MKLTESEGKTFLKKAGIPVPDFTVIEKNEGIPESVSFPLMLKAQSLVGGRGKAGLVKEVADHDEAKLALKSIWKSNYSKRPFSTVLIEQKVESIREYYISISYDQASRTPVLIVSKFGGMDIEVVAKRQPDAILSMEVSFLKDLDTTTLRALFVQLELKEELFDQMQRIAENIIELFKVKDAELIEINPLIETDALELIAVDCKMSIDDTAMFRQSLEVPDRVGARELTEREQQARAIDARSHRGVVGRSYLELDGDIGFMSSGGGASITCLDALVSYGGRPANFVEYSGNPEREDVRDLTKIVLSQDIRALWVVGPTANFTDIYETIAGIIDALEEVKPSYPIVIRRAGPRDDEAKKLIETVKEQLNLDITFYGEEVSMTESAKLLLDMLNST